MTWLNVKFKTLERFYFPLPPHPPAAHRHPLCFEPLANETGAFRRPLMSFGSDGRWRFFVVRVVVLALAEVPQEVAQAVHFEEDDRRDEQREKL